MLTEPHVSTDNAFEQLRAREFGRLDEAGIAYLDYAAAALYSASQVSAYADRLRHGVFGNPHSEHTPSRVSEGDLAKARALTLAHFDADPDLYEVCFTANTTAAIKLVAESYPFGPRRGLTLSADNHNSMNGMREYARAAGAPVMVLPIDATLALDDAPPRLALRANVGGAGLFGFPSQSNFSGVRHSLDLANLAEGLGYDVMIDAAGAGVSGCISLTRHPAAFLVFSFYKIFGLPTGVGGLVVRREALARLRRPWFSGGTVDFVSIEHDRHQLRSGCAGFEDGTPNFLDIGAVPAGFDFLRGVDMSALGRRLDDMTSRFIQQASALKRSDGSPLVRIYGPSGSPGSGARGPTVAFNLLSENGFSLPYQLVEAAARQAGVAIRGGCFCNPGAAEQAFGFSQHDIPASLDTLRHNFSPAHLHHHLGPHATVGALRLSLGLPTSAHDIDRAIELIKSFGVGAVDQKMTVATMVSEYDPALTF